MIPQYENLLDFTVAVIPNKTYLVDLDKGMIRGQCDGLEAIRQFVLLALNTERYRYEIYSWRYGIELEELIGGPMPLVYAKISDNITEALIYDERILAVNNFSFNRRRNAVSVSFQVQTVYGDLDMEKEVRTGV